MFLNFHQNTGYDIWSGSAKSDSFHGTPKTNVLYHLMKTHLLLLVSCDFIAHIASQVNHKRNCVVS